jgi:selenide,water dikinase
LRSLPPVEDANVLVSMESAEDCAVYRVSETHAIVQTVDFFTPIVDDPFLFGQIAAANSLSDIYAMGVEPLFALNIMGFPRHRLPLETMAAIFRGGAAKAREAGIFVLGGHTIEDSELKYGLVVTAYAEISQIVTNAGAKPGDDLVLTKPLGVGAITSAIQRRIASEALIEKASVLMATLNRDAAAAVREVGVHGLTDVTGFGLLGHLLEVTQASNVSAEIFAHRLPTLDEAWDLVRKGKVPAATQTNLDYVDPHLRYADAVSREVSLMLADPQTSGGLLIALPPERTERLLSRLRELKTPAAACIGRITEPQDKRIIVRT